MIIGSDRDEVIENIKRAAESGNFFAKVETHDPVLTTEESNAIINKYLKERGTASFRMRSCAARGIANVLTDVLCRDTEIVGIEKAQTVSGGAIITSNHFSPVENTGIRLLARRLGRKRINIVSQPRHARDHRFPDELCRHNPHLRQHPLHAARIRGHTEGAADG